MKRFDKDSKVSPIRPIRGVKMVTEGRQRISEVARSPWNTTQG